MNGTALQEISYLMYQRCGRIQNNKEYLRTDSNQANVYTGDLGHLERTYALWPVGNSEMELEYRWVVLGVVDGRPSRT